MILDDIFEHPVQQAVGPVHPHESIYWDRRWTTLKELVRTGQAELVQVDLSSLPPYHPGDATTQAWVARIIGTNKGWQVSPHDQRDLQATATQQESAHVSP